MTAEDEPEVPTEDELSWARAAIAAAPDEVWAELAESFAELQAAQGVPERLGHWGGGQEVEPDVRQLPYAVLGATARRVLSAVDGLGVSAPRAWMRWDEGRRIVADPDLIAAADPAVCALLIGTLRRNDRFVEGALLSAFERGLMADLLAGVLRGRTPG